MIKIRLYIIIFSMLAIIFFLFPDNKKKYEIEQNIDYSKNNVQKLFMELDDTINEQRLINLTKEYSLKYKITQYSTDSRIREGIMEKTNHYIISKSGDAIKRSVNNDDYIEVSFNDINKIIFAEYTYKDTNKYMPFRSLIYYAEKHYNSDKGYYIDMRNIEDKKNKGVEEKSYRGTSKTSKYRYNTAEEGINEIIKAAHTNWSE